MDRRVPDAQGSGPAPVDPVYYSARELDVYPLPLAPLTAAYPSHLLNAQVAGNVLVSVLVNEAGTVDRVTVVAGEPPGYFEEHAHATLASARFIPGRRDGKAVRSRVTVRVDFNPAAPASAIR
jgi:protein TonB